MNTTVQLSLHMGPTPNNVLVKEGMMYTVVGNSDAKCWIGSVSVDGELSTCSFAVPTLICEEIVLGGPCSADGEMYR